MILRRGKLVASQGAWDRKIYAMSATKSVASLAVGLLIDDGLIQSLDQPVSDFVSQWKEGEKSKITIRMLLNHTSGLDTHGRGVPYALNAPLVYPPGTAFVYNNPAVDLLGVVIEKASGVRADLYIARRLFEPLGIADWDWAKDSAGNPLIAGELQIRPADLAKIGQMVLDGGVWNGRHVLSKSWLERSVEASQPFDPTCGLLWWRDAQARSIGFTPRLLEAWGRAGVRAEVLDPMRPLVGRPMKDMGELIAAMRAAYQGHPSYLKELNAVLMRNRLQWYEVIELGPVEGFSAQGWLGQFLVVDLKRGLVGVRMRDSRPSDYPTLENPHPPYVDTFDDFPKYVHELAPAL
ncbi:MAG: beta-lactamase family protein [Elusimicrobia bacterium]|nr:beta-lactamase family protein [Elusimicrobiota bacterium]